jgi:uncharacterized protein involved in outer membrane biogenesis
MKKFLLIFLGVIVFIIGVLAIIPIFFKDEIQAKVKEEIANNVDARVDFSDVSLSLFRNFPDLTISIDKLGVIGVKEGFAGDTLFSVDNFRVSVDIMSVIKGEQIKVKGIYLNNPYVLTKFTKDGKLSWDIAKASTEDTLATEQPSEPGSFSLAIEEWKITNATIVYDDQSMPMYMEIRGMNHSGSGDMTGDIFNMKSNTNAPEMFLSYDNITYLNKNKLDADVNMKIDLAKSEYTFMENRFAINDFVMHFEGLISMPADDIDMDIKYNAVETDFKTLLSLVPAIYSKDFEHIKTEGKLGFDGWVKGKYNDNSLPGFGLNLVVNEAMMKYPNLTPVNNIAIDLHVLNNDGNMNNTIIDLKKFNMDMGQNPVRAKALVQGLGPMDVDANVKASVNLAEVNKMYPIEGTTLAGAFGIDVTAKGTYDEAKKKMPNVNAKMTLKDGYVKSQDVPFPLEKLNMSAIAKSNGEMANTSVLLEYFNMLLDGEPFEMKAYVENFDNMKYDVNLKGLIDLAKLTKVYPMEDMTLAGRIKADITTKGVMSDVEAGRYDKTQTSGTMGITNFKYISKDMPQGMTLSSANFSLTPAKMAIESLDGTVGKSDISVKGFFSNYMGYMFGHSGDTLLHGVMTLNSKKFDVNEWMTEEETPAPASPQEEEPLTVVEVPKNIDFTFSSKMDQVLYDNMILENMAGNIIVRNGIVKMDKLGFNTMGGSFLMNGSYNTQNMKDPKFDFDMKIKDVELKQAYNQVDMVKKYASMAGNMDGKFSTDLIVAGSLGQDMMPVYKTVNGGGKVIISSATIKDNKALAGIAGLTKMDNLNPLAIKDVVAKFRIKDGNLEVEPFDIKAGNMKMNVSGKQSLEGELDYLLKTEVPAGALGTAANNSIAKLTGTAPAEGIKTIKLDFKVRGPYNDPKVGLAGSSADEQTKDAAKDAVKDAAKDKIEDKLGTELPVNKEEVKEEVKKVVEEKKEEVKQELKKEVEEKGKEAVKDALKGLGGKKK